MKRFRFPLRPVAILRAHQEMRAKEAFGAAVHAFARAESELAATRARVAQFEQALRAGRKASFSATEAIHALAAYRTERVAEAESEKAVQTARVAMNQRRDEYLEAHHKVKVVQRLEEKARESYRLAILHEEQAEQDDFAGRRAAERSTLFPV